MQFEEPNVEVGNTKNNLISDVKSTFNYYLRTYAPTYVTEKVDSMIEKKKSLEESVKNKINEVFTTCERIVDHYIPDAVYDRSEEDEQADMFTRMNTLSHNISTRVCDHFLPFLQQPSNVKEDQTKEDTNKDTEEVKDKEEKKSFIKSVKEPLNQVTKQCVETVTPVVEPFYPILTPLFSLLILTFTVIHAAFNIIVIEPILYIYSLCVKYLSNHKDEFVADENGDRPIVSKATDAYNQLKESIMETFVDEKGNITMTKFQALCSSKKEEYEELLKENLTSEKIQEFLTKTQKDVKTAVDEKLKPVKDLNKEGKKYCDEILNIFTDDHGHFSTAKVQKMVGQSGKELAKLIETTKQNISSHHTLISTTIIDKLCEVSDIVMSKIEYMKDSTLSFISIAIGIIMLFPTICFLLTIFVLSCFMDLDDIVPTPTVTRIINVIDTVEVKQNVEGKKTTVTVAYDTPTFEENESSDEEKKDLSNEEKKESSDEEKKDLSNEEKKNLSSDEEL